MAIEQNLAMITLNAGADLSSKQYTFIKINSSGKAVNTVDGERSIGVLQDKPTLDRAGAIAHAGISKVVAGGTIASGAAVASDLNGKAITATTGKQILGYALEAGANNRIISVLLDRVGAA
jgi:hypothetical protein